MGGVITRNRIEQEIAHELGLPETRQGDSIGYLINHEEAYPLLFEILSNGKSEEIDFITWGLAQVLMFRAPSLKMLEEGSHLLIKLLSSDSPSIQDNAAATLQQLTQFDTKTIIEHIITHNSVGPIVSLSSSNSHALRIASSFAQEHPEKLLSAGIISHLVDVFSSDQVDRIGDALQTLQTLASRKNLVPQILQERKLIGALSHLKSNNTTVHLKTLNILCMLGEDSDVAAEAAFSIAISLVRRGCLAVEEVVCKWLESSAPIRSLVAKLGAFETLLECMNLGNAERRVCEDIFVALSADQLNLAYTKFIESGTLLYDLPAGALKDLLTTYLTSPQMDDVDKLAPWYVDPARLPQISASRKTFVLHGQQKDTTFVTNLYLRHPVPGMEIKNVSIVNNISA